MQSEMFDQAVVKHVGQRTAKAVAAQVEILHCRMRNQLRWNRATQMIARRIGDAEQHQIGQIGNCLAVERARLCVDKPVEKIDTDVSHRAISAEQNVFSPS